jgi:hypothetical protein
MAVALGIDLSADTLDGLCDGWCSLTVEGGVNIQFPLPAG